MILIKDELSTEIENYLKDQGYLMPDEQIIKYEKAGEGNMNMVVRITTDAGTVIVKQSRPFVHKYPQITAPIDRIKIEREYYQTINRNEVLKKYSPEIFDYDDDNYTVLMEDLGLGVDSLGLYDGSLSIDDTTLFSLLDYILTLHSIKDIKFPENKEMKALNHEHIFIYPFLEENGFNLDTIQPGLQSLSLQFKKDEALKKKIIKIGDRYLENGNTLLHGDFYPGSWLMSHNRIKVIDPEFSFMGDPEFDLAVMVANLYMTAMNKSRIEECIKYYTNRTELNKPLLNKYIGTEILRRIIGLAQLPVKKDLEFKSSLCKMACEYILS